MGTGACSKGEDYPHLHGFNPPVERVRDGDDPNGLNFYSGWKILIVSVDEAEDADEDEDEVVVVGEGGVDEEEGEAVVVVTAEEGVVVVVLVTAHIKKDGKTISKVDSELIIFNKPEQQKKKKCVLSYGFTKFADVETPNGLMVL